MPTDNDDNNASPEEGDSSWLSSLLVTEEAAAASFLVMDPAIATAAIQSTAKLLCAIVLGVIAARCHILTPSAVDALAKLTYHIFQPCLMLCSIATTLNHHHSTKHQDEALSTRSLFVLMPAVSLAHTLTGYMTSKLITATVPLRSLSDACDIVMSVTFANSAPLPLVLASSLFDDVQLQGDATACISFYLLVLSPIFYSLGTQQNGFRPCCTSG